MQTWNLIEGDPITLTLAADARFSQVDYFDDQIWELSLRGGEPAALTFQSTLGLRSRWIRFFPQFSLKNTTLCDPRQFHQPPRIVSFHPNTIAVNYFPFANLEIRSDYWLPSSKVAAGRISLINHERHHQIYRLNWIGQLNPIGEGTPFTYANVGGQSILRGRLEGQTLVCVLSNNPYPSKGALPGLALDVTLHPGRQQHLTWVLVCAEDERSALELARSIMQKKWDAEMAQIELVNASQQVEITTGNENWNAVLALTQKTAFSLIVPGKPKLPYPTMVRAREPDQGYSPRRDGSDTPMLWKGQTALDLYYLSSLILPDGVDLVKGLLRNFLSTQELTGHINWQTSPVGSSNNHLALPLLASLAWKIFEIEDDLAWLNEIYPALFQFIKVWFEKEHDRDGDGFPEWEHPLQTGLEDIPLFDRWHPMADGVDIKLIESPCLAAFLHQDLACLQKMARQLNQLDDLSWLVEKTSTLANALMQSWDEKKKSFHYRDYQNHQTKTVIFKKSFQGAGEFDFHKQFLSPQRIQLQYNSHTQTTHPISVYLVGQNTQGEVKESLPARDWHWSSAKAVTTSQNLYTQLNHIEIRGVLPEDIVTLKSIDYAQEDISLLLPIWAGIPTSDQVATIIKSSWFTNPTHLFGLPTCQMETCPTDIPFLNAASPLWNQFVLEGLHRYGYRELAAEFFGKLMDAIVLSLQTRNAFYEFYNVQSGTPGGQRNHLHGLAPVGLLLNLAGIQKITKNQIILSHFSPFPWTITVKYHKVEIQNHPTHAVVTFPNGQSACVKGPGPHLVTLLPTPGEINSDAIAHIGAV